MYITIYSNILTCVTYTCVPCPYTQHYSCYLTSTMLHQYDNSNKPYVMESLHPIQ